MKLFDKIKNTFAENKKEIFFSIIYEIMIVLVIGLWFIIWMKSDLYTALFVAISATSFIVLIASNISNLIFKERVIDSINKCINILPLNLLIILAICCGLFLLLISAITLNILMIFLVVIPSIVGLGILWFCCTLLFLCAFAFLKLSIKHRYLILIIGLVSGVLGILSFSGILPISQWMHQLTESLFNAYIAIKNN